MIRLRQTGVIEIIGEVAMDGIVAQLPIGEFLHRTWAAQHPAPLLGRWCDKHLLILLLQFGLGNGALGANLADLRCLLFDRNTAGSLGILGTGTL